MNKCSCSGCAYGLFTLAKVSGIMPATVTATRDSHYLSWQHGIARNYPFCVVSPKVVKASTMVTVSRVDVAGIIALHFANVNMALGVTKFIIVMDMILVTLCCAT